MPSVSLTEPSGHMQKLFQHLAVAGWTIEQLPASNRLPRNRVKLSLIAPNHSRRIRVSIYKIGNTGRSKPDERRVEITKTYLSGLKRSARYSDVVLGYEPILDVYVGLDPRRLEHGGHTSNASTFVDRNSVLNAPANRINIRPYPAPVLGGTEFQAYFKPERLSEYLFNQELIHGNFYSGYGLYSGSVRPLPIPDLIECEDESTDSDTVVAKSKACPIEKYIPKASAIRAFEDNDIPKLRAANLTPEQFQAIRKICDENGLLGEQYVLETERKRLRKLGREDLASLVEWTSQISVNHGYDIHSFEEDGEDRLIEVKSTSGTGKSFDISINEWETAKEYGVKYHIYRVMQVRTSSPNHIEIKDPWNLERKGLISITPNGYRINLSNIAKQSGLG